MTKEMDKMWTNYEKNVFLTILQSYVSLAKGKRKLDSEMFEWDSIQKNNEAFRFKEMTGIAINADVLKNKWEEMKQSAKGHLQLGNVSSSEYIKVLAICLGIFNVTDDFGLSGVRTELQVDFQPPKFCFEQGENLGNTDQTNSVPSVKKKRKKGLVSDGSLDDVKRAAFLEEEFKLKKINLERELQHQATRHKLEIEILNLKKKVMLKRLENLNKVT